MTTLQVILLILAIPATLYQLLKVGQISALMGRYGRAHITGGLWFWIFVTLGIQAALVLALTGRIAA